MIWPPPAAQVCVPDFFSALYQPNITPEPQMDDYFAFKTFNQNMDYSLETFLQ